MINLEDLYKNWTLIVKIRNMYLDAQEKAFSPIVNKAFEKD